MPSIAESLPLPQPSPWWGVSLLIVISALGGCASQAATPLPCAKADYHVNDPAENINRHIFAFNRGVDTYVLKPVAHGYQHLPDPVQHGVHNFVSNFGEPKVFVNDLLQANFKRSANTLGRFVVNTTVGLVGVMDVASRWGMPHHAADFGQTFGVWGANSGPTLELPLLGTSSVRDGLGRVAGFVIDPLGGVSTDTYNTLDTLHAVGGVVDGRARALPATDAMERMPDYYQAQRDAKGTKRNALVLDGKRGAIEADDLMCRPGYSLASSLLSNKT